MAKDDHIKLVGANMSIRSDLYDILPWTQHMNPVPAIPELLKLAAIELFVRDETSTDRAVAVRVMLKSMSGTGVVLTRHEDEER